jgi:predicted Zn-dependent peptidase
MDEFLNHSLLSNSTLEEAKYLLASRLDSIEEDGDAVAANLAMELAGENHPLSIPMTGRKEDLDKIDLACMERLLAKWQGAPKIILAAGRRYADMDAFLDTVVQERVSQFACPLVKEGNVRFKVAEKQIVQSSLCQIWTTGISPWDADFESLLVLNLMLGQGQKSLLFDSVREQESLCYAISSNLIRYDGVLMVNAGIMADAADKVLDMTKAQVKRLADGDFEDGRLESALLELQDRRKGSQDHAAALLEREFRRGMGLPVRHNPVTRESIMAVADRLALKSWALVKEAS